MDVRNIFRGELVELRAVDASNAGAYREWFSDPEVVQFLGRGIDRLTREAQAAAIDGLTSDGRHAFGIHALADGRVIGTCDLVVRNARSRTGGIGMAIGDKTAWGKGYGTDAVRILLRFGFTELNLHRIELEAIAFNERALRCYFKAGFVEEGRRRQAFYRGGTYHDLVHMSVLEHEWKT